MRFITLLLFFSCSSIDAKAPWIEQISATKIQRWRICNSIYDGDDKAFKGFCRTSKECRKKFLAKDECRPKPLFCAFEDKDCIIKYELYKKTLIEI